MPNPELGRCLSELRKNGINGTVAHRGKHLKLSWAAGGGERSVFVSSTPSDWRSAAQSFEDFFATAFPDLGCNAEGKLVGFFLSTSFSPIAFSTTDKAIWLSSCDGRYDFGLLMRNRLSS
jgi:hypothetical protein